MRNCGQSPCCGSCSCNTGCTPCSTQQCKGTITEAELGTLLYAAGLDANLCKKYQLVSSLTGFRDCAGNTLVPGVQLVTCAAFQDRLCAAFATLPLDGPLTAGDEVITADCTRKTFPAFQAPLAVQDTSSVDLTLNAGTLSADVRISPDPGNILEIHPNGVFADIDAADLCDAFSDIPAGAVATAGTVLLGNDCQTHALPPFQAPLTFNDTPSVDFTVVGTTVTADVRISPTPGNSATIDPGGVYVPAAAAQTPITPVDTPTVNLTVSGVNNHTLQADVNVSPNAGNILEALGNGLFVDIDAADLCPALSAVPAGGPATTSTELLGADCLTHSLENFQIGLNAEDTVTVDLTLEPDGDLSADVNVSAQPNNALQILGDGLYVAQAAATDVQITATDTPCIDMTVNEGLPNVFQISATPIIAPGPNALSCTPSGLLVTPAAITCAGVVAAFPDGDVLQAGDEVLSADCTAKEFPAFVGGDTPCIDTSVTTLPGGAIQISSAPIVAPTYPGYTGNGLQCTPTGLAAPPVTLVTEGEITLGGLLVDAPMINGQVISSPLITLNITNPSAVRAALLTVEMIIPAVTWNSTIDFGNLSIEGNHSFNLPGFIVTALSVFTTWAVIGAASAQSGTPPGSRIQGSWIVPAGFVGSYSVQWNVTMDTGAATLVNVGNVGARYTLVAA